jgi:hypothetical protein
MWLGGRSRYVGNGLSVERKALIDRYTDDGMLRLERVAAEIARLEAQQAARSASEEPLRVKRNGRTQRRADQPAQPRSKSREPLMQSVPDAYGRLRSLCGENGQIRCANCKREGSPDIHGWTLELCGDNQLHPFCSACQDRFSQVA